MSDNTLDIFKKQRDVQKFMREYRYHYHVTMLPDLAELVRNAYVEGYNNGLKQYPVNDLLATPPAIDTPRPSEAQSGSTDPIKEQS